ncbi:MAG: hypothetical protein ACRC8S_07185 [Fimbriiglobus sp.]
MLRFRFVAFVGLLAFVTALADDSKKPAGELNEKLEAELKPIQEQFLAQYGKAVEKLEQAFTEQEKKLKNANSLKVDVQVKALKELKTDHENFEKNKDLPKSASMKAAGAEFKKSLEAAKTKCEEAYTKVAKAYRDKKDLESAAAVLAAKDSFFEKALGKPDNRTYWVSATRTFVMGKDGNWTENNTKDKKQFSFKEIERTPQYIQMLDSSRGQGFYVRLSKEKMLLKIGTTTERWSLYDEGSWKEPPPAK